MKPTRVTYLPPDEEIPLEEQDERECDSDLLCPTTGDFTFQSDRPFPSTAVVADQEWSPNYQCQGFFDGPQLSTNLPLEPLPLTQFTVPAGAGNTPSR